MNPLVQTSSNLDVNSRGGCKNRQKKSHRRCPNPPLHNPNPGPIVWMKVIVTRALTLSLNVLFSTNLVFNFSEFYTLEFSVFCVF